MDDADDGRVVLDTSKFALFINDVVMDGENDPDENTSEKWISLNVGGRVVNGKSNPKDDDRFSFFIDRGTKALEHIGNVEDCSSSDPSCINTKATPD